MLSLAADMSLVLRKREPANQSHSDTAFLILFLVHIKDQNISLEECLLETPIFFLKKRFTYIIVTNYTCVQFSNTLFIY